MRYKRRILARGLVVFLYLATVCSTATAAILSASVTQNGSLYTYSYTLNNTSGSGPISEVSVLVSYGNSALSEPPTSYSGPAGWNFDMAFSGGIASPPYNALGFFWDWGNLGSPLPAGQNLNGFSFTTSYAPTTSTSNNYFLYCPSSCGSFTDGIVEYGNIVAPEITAPNIIPEPSAFLPVLVLAIAAVLSRRFASSLQ